MDIDELLYEIKELFNHMNAYDYNREKEHFEADEILIKALRLASRDSGCDTYSEIADIWEKCRAEGFYYM